MLKLESGETLDANGNLTTGSDITGSNAVMSVGDSDNTARNLSDSDLLTHEDISDFLEGDISNDILNSPNSQQTEGASSSHKRYHEQIDDVKVEPDTNDSNEPPKFHIK